jgi:Tol biopolymer transport system component
MPEVQEVFRMATQKVRQDPGAHDRLRDRKRRSDRNRKAGVFALAIVITALIVGVVLHSRTSSVPASQGPSTSPTQASQSPIVQAGAGSIVNIGTGKITPLAGSIADIGSYYAPSPDGQKVVFTLCCSPIGGLLYIENLDGTDANLDGNGPQTVLSMGSNDGLGAQWSSDGSQVLFQSAAADHQGFGSLQLWDYPSEARATVLDFGSAGNDWRFVFPSFAPGGRVLYQLPTKTGWNLWSAPISGGGQPTLVQRNAAWGGISLDGSLAYVSAVSSKTFDGATLFVRPAGGGAQRALVTGGHISWVRWSPDGTKISYSNSGTIYVVDVASGHTTPVGTGKTAEWLNNDSLIVGPGPQQ